MIDRSVPDDDTCTCMDLVAVDCPRAYVRAESMFQMLSLQDTVCHSAHLFHRMLLHILDCRYSSYYVRGVEVSISRHSFVHM